VSDSSPCPNSDPTVTQCWAERLQRFAASNQTVTSFCAAEGISKANFYLWKQRLSPHQTTPIKALPRIVPIRVTPSPTAPIELAMPSGIVLRFPADTRPEFLVAVLRGLEQQSC